MPHLLHIEAVLGPWKNAHSVDAPFRVPIGILLNMALGTEKDKRAGRVCE